MKPFLVAAAIVASAAVAHGQTQNIQQIQTMTPPSSHASEFSIGPRVSSYSTDIDGGLATLKTGRQSSFGVVGEYRSGQLALDFNFDHDPENGISLSDLIIDTGNYSRDRGEFTIGYAVAPVLDLQGGVRWDTIRIGGASIFGTTFLSDLDIDHQALTAGLKLHTGDGQPVGFYALGRGYLGSAKFDVQGAHVNTDTTGFRGEAGINIRLGEGNWYLVPGLEYEHLETKDYNLRLNSNRAFLSFVYRSR